MTIASVRSLRQRWSWIFVTFFGGGFFLLLAGAIWGSIWIAGCLLALAAVCGLLQMQLRCPRCGQRVLWRPIIPGSHLVGYWSPLIPRRCLRCDLPL